MIKIYSPKKNLGCLGFQLGSFYMDFFKIPYFGMFIRASAGIWIGVEKRRVFARIEKGDMIIQKELKV